MDEWNQYNFEELCEIIYRYPSYYGIDYVENGIPEVRGELINKDGSVDSSSDNLRYISEGTAVKFPKTTLRKGDIVLSVRGTIGKIGIIPPELEGANMTANLLRISPSKTKVNQNYFKQLLLSRQFQLMLESITTATTIKTFKVADLKGLRIAIPSLNEQQKIASILSSVDEAIEKTEAIIEQTENLEDGLRQELLKKGINHTEFKDSSFGHIPTSWKNTFLEEVVDINSDSISSKVDELESINYIDIASIQNNRIAGTTEYTFKDAPSRARRKVKTGDIIVSTVRPYLKGFAYITEQYNNSICSTGFSVLRTKQECHSEYLYQIILSNRFVNYLISNMTGSSYPAVKANDIKNYNFPLPPLEEQIKISNILNQSRNKINLEQKKLSELLNIKNGLMQQLLTGKVRVPLNEHEEVPQ